ncbi:DNA alkylation repair protein [bacterium]|nr:DNA alkylation repair protein [bacterium]
MLDVQQAMRAAGSAEKAAHSLRFFKTGPGQYGEGDRFIGLTVPQTRSFVTQSAQLSFEQLDELLHSPWHEERLLALILMCRRFKRDRHRIYQLYLANVSGCVNNWDLVDTSAPTIVGGYLLPETDRKILYRLAESACLWERRVAVLATLTFIRADQFEDVLALCQRLLGDREDLMHKACGWMLREAGKRQLSVLLQFLEQCSRRMPRTMLRYAIEKLSPEQRRHFMARE